MTGSSLNLGGIVENKIKTRNDCSVRKRYIENMMEKKHTKWNLKNQRQIRKRKSEIKMSLYT